MSLEFPSRPTFTRDFLKIKFSQLKIHRDLVLNIICNIGRPLPINKHFFEINNKVPRREGVFFINFHQMKLLFCTHKINYAIIKLIFCC